MRSAKVIKAFPFALDGINVSHLALGTTFPPDGSKIADSTFDGLVASGYLEETKSNAKVPAEEQLNRDIIDAFDRKLLAASDEELKAIIARSGTPFSGNLVHATLVFAAKQQMLRELQGSAPVFSVDPNAGVTEQPLSAPGQATPPSAAAAIQQQDLLQQAADKNGAENKAVDQFGVPIPSKKSADGDLEGMTKAELENLADDRKIDVSAAKTKADLIASIRAAN